MGQWRYRSILLDLGRFTPPGKSHRYPLKGCMGSRTALDAVEKRKSLACAGNLTLAVHHYTDLAIPLNIAILPFKIVALTTYWN
jgi:hypothetical protein